MPGTAQLLRQAVRVPDPFQAFEGAWIVRRLAPDCRKIEVGQPPRRSDHERFLRAMGWKVANVHLATGKPRAILRDLDRRPEAVAGGCRRADGEDAGVGFKGAKHRAAESLS